MMHQERRFGQVAQRPVALFGREVLFDKLLFLLSLPFARGLHPRGIEVINTVFEAAKACEKDDSVMETVWRIPWSDDDITVRYVLVQGGGAQNARTPRGLFPAVIQHGLDFAPLHVHWIIGLKVHVRVLPPVFCVRRPQA